MAKKTEPAEQEIPVMDQIAAAIEKLPAIESWAIDLLCRMQLATQFRPMFRVAAEEFGEAGVLRLLQVMVTHAKDAYFNQLVMASSACIAAARANGKGILLPQHPGTMPATELANKLAQQARDKKLAQQARDKKRELAAAKATGA